MKDFNTIHKREMIHLPGLWNLPKIPILLSVILFFLCAHTGVYGQQFVTSTATVSGGNAFPFNSTADNKVEMTYGPNEFNLPTKAGYIKQVYFRFTGSASASYTNFSISMAQLSTVTATTTYTTPVSVCFGPTSYSMAATGGVWFPIKLTTPFLYNPKLILVVVVQMSAGTGLTIGFTTSTLARGRLYGSYGSATGVGSDNERYDFGMDVAPAGNNNAGVTSLITPKNFCPGTYGIQVKAANLGQNAMTSVNIGWSFDGVIQTPISWPYNIPSGRDTTITLGSKVFATGALHNLKAWTYSPNNVKDTIPADDTLFVNNMTPAISGTYTINPGGGTGGTNFTSFTSAANFISTNGICGPVLFKVTPGTYNESVSVGAVNGTSATNTITFDGGDSTKTIVSSNAANTFVLNGCSYVTLRRLGIVNTGQQIALHLTAGASFNTVTGCIAKTDSTNTSSTSSACAISGSTPTTSDNANNNNITHCIFVGGYYGVTAYGNTSTESIGNSFTYCKMLKAYQYSNYFLYQNKFNFQFNYVSDRATISCLNLWELISNATVNGNYFNIHYEIEWIEIDYAVVLGTTVISNNVFYGHYYTSTCVNLIEDLINTKFYYNTFYETGPGASFGIELAAASNLDIRNNIFYRTSSSQYAFYLTGSPTNCSFFDYNDIVDGPGVSGGNYAYYGSTVYPTLGALQSYLSTFSGLNAGQKCANCQNIDPGFINVVPGSENFHMCPTCYGVSGAGPLTVTTDIDGQTRCGLFPNMGFDEVLTGKGKPSVKFFPTSNIFPGSPSVVYSTFKPGSPTKNTWYLMNSTYPTLTKVPKEGFIDGGDSVTLYTTKFTTGFNTLRLVTVTCGGTDSFTAIINIAAPTAVPSTDFVSNLNSVVTGTVVKFQDLSTNGPQTWSWKISPDSVIAGGAKVPSFQYTFPAAGGKGQNPQVKFLYPGSYTVCLSTTNGVGKGPTVCKTNYITVLPSVNIGTTVVTNASGYLYDDGGPSSAYISNGGAPGTLIAPCADSVYLTFSMFDLNCNVAFLQLYEGNSVKGRRLDPCGGTGLNSGFTGGPSGAICTAPCMPSVTRPDTFKAAKSIFIQMNDGATNPSSKGFAAYWWSKPSSAKRPHANFTTNGSHDSVCVNAQVNFTNTSTTAAGDQNDALSYLWDLDGDLTTWECIGTCSTALWPYFLAGPTNVTLLATNCGGTDTFVKTLTVYTPKAPKSAISADNTTPAIGQTVFFTSPVVACVDDYKWTITKSAGSGTGIATYINNTTNISANPQVIFSDLGYYDVKLYVDNNSGAAKDSITLKQYINVRGAYCIPSVAILNQGMGISSVTLNTLSNKTTQAQQDYTNFTGNQALSTSLALNVKYPITITRDPSLIFNPINRSVFIDWNGDGLFSGPGEEAALDSNSYSASWTGTITVPKTAKLGATVMRIAVNRGANANLPCGQNQFGEYQDYTVYITPYKQAPVITLTGHQGLLDTIRLEQGHPFVEPGYKATSLLYGDITRFVKRTSLTVGDPNPADSFNDIVAGKYIFSYNVTDSAGNKAITLYRVVQVTKDVTPPVLVIAKPDTTEMEVTATPLTPFPAPKVISAVDLVDGPLDASVTNDAAKVTSNVLGFYTITYTVSDLSGNKAIVYRWIHVIDTIAPTLTLVGASPVTSEVNTPYIDGGVIAKDNYWSTADLNSRIKTVSTVDTSKIGSYKVSYFLSDSSGNVAQSVTRIVNIIDTISPAISLNGNQLDSVEVFTNYNDPGVQITDNYNKLSDITLTVTGSYYSKFTKGSKPSVIGVYTIIYTAIDQSGNKSVVTRTVNVIDRIAPVITLIGDPDVSVCRWFTYVDAGYTLSDNYDKNSDIVVTKVGSFLASGTTIENLLSLQYVATDKSLNVGYSATRNILVKSLLESPCTTSGIAPGLSLDKYIAIYPNPNNGIFQVSANLPANQKVRMSISNVLGQEIAIIHNGYLGTNNFQVDLSNQVSGVYLLNIVSENQTLTKRIEIVK